MQKPPIRDVPYASENVHEFAPADKCHPEERSASHDLGVVKIALELCQLVRRKRMEDGIPIYARIIERGSVVVHEKVTIKPTCKSVSSGGFGHENNSH
jgi:hypothetical protein